MEILLTSVATFTVVVAVFCVPSVVVAVITAFPNDFAVIIPFSSTVAIFSLLDFHETAWLASSGKILAANVYVSIPASRSIPTTLSVTITSSSKSVLPSGIIRSNVFTGSVTIIANVSVAPPPSAAVALITTNPFSIPVTSPVVLFTEALEVIFVSQTTA